MVTLHVVKTTCLRHCLASDISSKNKGKIFFMITRFTHESLWVLSRSPCGVCFLSCFSSFLGVQVQRTGPLRAFKTYHFKVHFADCMWLLSRLFSYATSLSTTRERIRAWSALSHSGWYRSRNASTRIEVLRKQKMSNTEGVLPYHGGTTITNFAKDSNFLYHSTGKNPRFFTQSREEPRYFKKPS